MNQPSIFLDLERWERWVFKAIIARFFRRRGCRANKTQDRRTKKGRPRLTAQAGRNAVSAQGIIDTDCKKFVPVKGVSGILVRSQ
jgi:hypothetical protein